MRVIRTTICRSNLKMVCLYAIVRQIAWSIKWLGWQGFPCGGFPRIESGQIYQAQIKKIHIFEILDSVSIWKCMKLIHVNLCNLFLILKKVHVRPCLRNYCGPTWHNEGAMRGRQGQPFWASAWAQTHTSKDIPDWINCLVSIRPVFRAPNYFGFSD